MRGALLLIVLSGGCSAILGIESLDPGQGEPDAGPDAPPASNVRVSVLDGEIGKANVDVFFHEGGVLTSAETTDANGVATARIEGTALVTVVDAGDGSAITLRTYQVSAGDEIRSILSEQAAGELSYSIPVGPPETTGMILVVGAQFVDQLATTGGFVGLKRDLELSAISVDDTVTMIALASNTAGAAIGFATATAARSLPSTEIELAAFAAPIFFGVDLTPAAGAPMDVGVPIVRGDIAYGLGVGFGALTTPVVSAFPIPAGFSDDVEIQCTDRGGESGVRTRVLRRRLPFSDGSVTVNMTTDVLRDLSGLTFSAGTQTIAWDPYPADAEVARINLKFGGAIREWIVELPSDLGSFTLPGLPASFAPIGSAVSITATVEDYAGYASYADYRKHLSRHSREALPARGTFRSITETLSNAP